MIGMTTRAVLLGAGLGLFSAFGDRMPIDTPLVVLVALANAVGPWVVVAFLAGAATRTARSGATLGAAALVMAVATYYVTSTLAYGSDFVDPVRAIVVWGVVALVVGPPLGAAGATWAAGGPLAAPAVGLLSGLLLAEAIVRFVEVEGWTGYDLGRTALQVTAVDAIVAVLAPALLLRRNRAVAIGVAVVVGLACAAVLAVVVPLIRDAATG